MLFYLQQTIENRSAPLAVIGLGYVGLPVACLFANAGFQVTGIDLNAERIAEINAGISPIKGVEPGLSELVEQVVGAGRLHVTADYAELAFARVVLIAVDTPIEVATNKPLYRALRGALTNLGKVMQPGTLVIVESTIAPGTMARIVLPTLTEVSGLVPNQDFWVGHCPERVMPGRLLNNLRKMDRVVGGQTPEVSEVMLALYRSYVEGGLDPTDPLTAELVKTGENTYRDINIAFANEMALICEAVGGNVWSVRTLLNKSPGRNMLMPGAGVGGHCIPKDPWLLAYGADGIVETQLIPAARAVNEKMPIHIAELMRDALQETGHSIGRAKIAILGYAYLENSDDTRHTPTATLLTYMKDMEYKIAIHDPFVLEYAGDVQEVLRDADCVIIMVAHQTYYELDLNMTASLMRHAVLIDGRHIYSEESLRKAGFIYRSLGIG